MHGVRGGSHERRVSAGHRPVPISLNYDDFPRGSRVHVTMVQLHKRSPIGRFQQQLRNLRPIPDY